MSKQLGDNHTSIHTSYFRAVANDLSPYANEAGQCRGGDAIKRKLRDIKDAIKTGGYSGLPANSKNP